MTPEWAQKLLANTENRNPNPQKIAQIRQDIEDDNWVEDGNPVRIDWDGVLRDGQNRLTAIAEAGIPVPVVLAENMDPASQMVMDTGTKRTFAHWLQIKGRTDTNNLAATTILLFNYTHGRMRTRAIWMGRRAVSHAQLWAFHLEHEEDNKEALKHAGHIVRHLRASKSVVAAAWRIFHGIDPEDAAAFFRQLIEEEPRLNGTGPYLLARQLNSRRRRERLDQQEQLALFIKAWNMFREGRLGEQIHWRGGGAAQEKFPEPE